MDGVEDSKTTSEEKGHSLVVVAWQSLTGTATVHVIYFSEPCERHEIRPLGRLQDGAMVDIAMLSLADQQALVLMSRSVQ